MSPFVALALLALLFAAPGSAAESGHHAPEMSPEARPVPHDDGAFAPDPSYDDQPYDAEAQVEIYGGKYLNPTQRPLLELGRRLYESGPFRKSPKALGATNLMAPQLLIYGDLRTSIAYNDGGNDDQATLAYRLNLDVDLRVTATERFHALIRPLDDGERFTRWNFAGDDRGFEWEGEWKPEALFFEGDLGAMLGGAVGRDAPFDLPVAAGLMPLLFQNGVWLEDAFTGAAFSIPARNSRLLDISNFDITFFAGFDEVTSLATPTGSSNARLYGATAFIEAAQGYFEIGYGFTEDRDGLGRDYHNVAFAFSRRYRNWFSNSVRVIGNFGQDPDAGRKTADGFLVLLENSLITSKPSTVVPYLNLFAGFDRPQSLARDPGAGGILKNVGILFETDGLTGFPRLDDTGFGTYGGALGINLMADDFGQQLVLETAVVGTHGGGRNRTAPGAQYGWGARYQRPLTNALILRVDAMYGLRREVADLMGARAELRVKF